MRKIKSFFAVVALLLTAAAAYAQDVRVSGSVTENGGEVVSGAAVQLKGSTTVYTMTDALGNYGISVPADGVLVISCLGYKTVEVPVSGRGVVNVTLETDTEKLEDVIVVAYGTVRREANTGSVSSMKADKLAEGPATSIDKMLAGKMAGVSITANSGQPGSTSTIRVRGTSSINAGNEPLWVVDGIPVINDELKQTSYYGDGGGGSSTAFINPNDIESITVLKDAAAASVYGSRAANGVILVTTKSGKSGQAKFTARAKFGAQQLANDNNYRPLTGTELVGLWRDAAVNGGYNPDDPTSAYYVPTSLADGSHNWYKDLTKVGLIQEYELSASGGNDKGTFFTSLAYNNSDGALYATGYKRFSARINADYKLTKTLKAGARVAGSYNSKEQGSITGSSFYGNPAYAMYSLLPWTPLKDADGEYTFPAENGKVNPMAYAMYNDYKDKEYHLNGTLFLEWKPIKQLTFKSNNSFEMAYVKTRMYSNPKADYDGVAELSTYSLDEQRLTTSNTAVYDDKFGAHSVRALLGQEAMVDKFEALSLYSPNIDPAIPYPTTSTTAQDSGGYSFQEVTLLSFFGVFDYSYDNRYFAQASVRTDGSSLFGANKKWGTFWSASASWNISNEKFMKSTQNWLSNLKLRVSYGVNGNNNIAAYRAYGVYATGEYNGSTTMYPSRPSNEDLSWEKNKTFNVGLDFGFFDNRLTGSLDVYNRLTTDMLLSVSVPYTTGFSSNLKNIGSLQNKGVEFQIEGEIIRSNTWNWSVGANIAFNRSKVLDLAGVGYLTAADYRYGKGNDTPVRIVEGMSLYNFYIRDYAGVNPTTGEGLFWTADRKMVTSDRSLGAYIYAGSPEPKCTGGFNTQVSWKGLSLSAYFDFVYGNKVLVGNWYTTDGEDTLSSNQTNNALNYWKQPGDTGVTPKPIAGGNNVWYAGYSTRFLQDGSYTRIKDVTLSYNLSEKALKAIHLKGVKFYLSALNPYTFHNVDAPDPDFGEIGYAYGGNYTMMKSFIGGIELTF